MPHGDDLAVQSCVAGASLPLVWSGQFARAHDMFALLGRALGRHGQRLGAATGLLTYSIQIELAVWEGRFDDARALLASDVSLDVPELPTTAVAVALLGGVAGDGQLVELAETWVENREIHPIVAPAVLTLRHIRASMDGRLGDAAVLADEAWQLLEAVRGVRSWGLIDAVVSGLAVGRIARARELVDAYAFDVETFGAQPFPVAVLLRCRSLLAMEIDHDDAALDAAHELVEHAHASGLVLLTVDALETIAASFTGATRPCPPPVCSARAAQPGTPSATAGATRHTPSSSTRSPANWPPTTPTPSRRVGRYASATPSSTPDGPAVIVAGRATAGSA